MDGMGLMNAYVPPYVCVLCVFACVRARVRTCVCECVYACVHIISRNSHIRIDDQKSHTVNLRYHREILQGVDSNIHHGIHCIKYTTYICEYHISI